jgi:hypothetical protein
MCDTLHSVWQQSDAESIWTRREEAPFPVAVWSKAYVNIRLVTGVACSNPAEGYYVRLLRLFCVV